ncbi:hypothetical protein Aph01nite_35230 [Acrocarpospora phusangensis]|uniref:Methylamine utilisation protein MauE domain-containing protein n=1 Tax=Acrocarpospora phusangensis TaxID=1070424 RepID=A0A919QD24_9ACTN|nr:MauE/DoxX family redox-associated membrane protein [Acrocarpospora phusangensis]GIH25213.1 hypothetical protein Aph01nite_35230 [Acrocarpospora phusangensis]
MSIGAAAYLVARFLIGAVFTVSALSKVRGPGAYARYGDATRALVPFGRPGMVAAVALIGEAAVPVLLAVAPAAGFVLAAALLTGFTVAIAGAVRNRRAVRCACFGPSVTPVGGAHLARNVFLLAAAACGLALGPAPAPEPALLAVLVAVSLFLTLLVLLTDLLAYLFAAPTEES